MTPSKGHSLGEYGLVAALIGVVAVGALSILGQTLHGQLNQISQTPNPTSKLLAPIAPTAGAANGVAVTGSFLPGNGAGSGLTGLPNYQAVATSVQTAGANGTTKVMADNITKLAQEQLAAGKITEDQANLLFTLANQGHFLADVEAVIEQAAKANTLTGDDFANQPVSFNGKQPTIHELYHELGFGQPYIDGLLSDPLNSMVQKGGYKTGDYMTAFITAYQQAQQSGALNDPAASAQVYEYSTAIATIADSLMFASIDRRNSERSSIDLTANSAARLESFDGSASTATNTNASDICTVGNGQKEYTGKGQRCSGG